MATYELEGTVKLIDEVKTFSGGFTKREFVVTTADDRYPQHIKFECVKERCALLDNIREGQKVKVSFDIRGSEYNSRYFVNLNAWKIEAPGSKGARGPAGDEPPLDENDAFGADMDLDSQF